MDKVKQVKQIVICDHATAKVCTYLGCPHRKSHNDTDSCTDETTCSCKTTFDVKCVPVDSK